MKRFTTYLDGRAGSMGWAGLVTFIAPWKGCTPKVGPGGRAYVMICGSRGGPEFATQLLM